jgi:molybdate transport system substrate-binding protein
VLVAASALLVAGCGHAAPPTTLTVLAAASLRDAFRAAATAYASTHPGIGLTFSFDASSALRAQVEQGAPVDVFASADVANPDQLVSAGRTIGPATPFAGNRLALIVPTANPAGIAAPADLARPGVALLTASANVPIAIYAMRVIANLAADPGAPAGFAAAVERNIVSREDNAAAVVAKVVLGEADAAFVYATDARAAGAAVSSIPLPDRVNVTAAYAAVVVRQAHDPAAAAAFVAWLAGPDGRAVLAPFGFVPPP